MTGEAHGSGKPLRVPRFSAPFESAQTLTGLAGIMQIDPAAAETKVARFSKFAHDAINPDFKRGQIPWSHTQFGGDPTTSPMRTWGPSKSRRSSLSSSAPLESGSRKWLNTDHRASSDVRWAGSQSLRRRQLDGLVRSGRGLPQWHCQRSRHDVGLHRRAGCRDRHVQCSNTSRATSSMRSNASAPPMREAEPITRRAMSLVTPSALARSRFSRIPDGLSRTTA